MILDAAFAAVPARALADAALTAATTAGATYADFRLRQVRSIRDLVRDGSVADSRTSTELGVGVRVLVDGTWGFAAGAGLTRDEVAAVARSACAVARAARPLRGHPVELADEPGAGEATWFGSYESDPFELTVADRVAPLLGWCDQVLASGLQHVDAYLVSAKETSFYADTGGAAITQQRIWVHPMVFAVRVDRAAGSFEVMRTLGPPTARGFEYLTGTGWDWDAELARMPEWLAEKAAAPAIEPGRYDLVIDPTNLWLTIHESVGHATELDRALGHEEAYAGGTFATPDLLGSLRYGSAAMNVTADRTTRHGLATIGFDDEGVAARRWDLVRSGTLVGLQVDRQTAGRAGLSGSNGCAYADSFATVPIQRMANISLQPDPSGPGLDALIAGVEDGIYVVGDRSWSIDMQRYNFQFTGQRFYRIRSGRLAGPLRDVAYRGSTPQFWGALEAVGGPQTYLLSGASQCGKGQPLQIAGAGHGCPAALFRGIDVLNTAGEAAR